MKSPYVRLAASLAINCVIMFFVTYAMMARASHFHANLNRGYMALMMTAPMLTVMLLVMRGMYADRRLNAALHVGAAALFLGAFGLARAQYPIGDDQFLRSMIPHHSSAILMCNEASIRDAEIVDLCRGIVESQQREIDQMERIMERRDAAGHER